MNKKNVFLFSLEKNLQYVEKTKRTGSTGFSVHINITERVMPFNKKHTSLDHGSGENVFRRLNIRAARNFHPRFLLPTANTPITLVIVTLSMSIAFQKILLIRGQS